MPSKYVALHVVLAIRPDLFVFLSSSLKATYSWQRTESFEDFELQGCPLAIWEAAPVLALENWGGAEGGAVPVESERLEGPFPKNVILLLVVGMVEGDIF